MRIRCCSADPLSERKNGENGEGTDSFLSYGRTVKEPVVGAPLMLAVLLNGSVLGSVVGVSPHWTETVKANVSPMSAVLKVLVRNMWFAFWPGASVMTGLISVKPVTPAPSVATILMLTYSVTVDGLKTPVFHVWTLLYLDRLNLWFHVSCES